MGDKEIEEEIRSLCYRGMRALGAVDVRRAAELHRRYPSLYARIHAEEKKRADDEMNPLSGVPK